MPDSGQLTDGSSSFVTGMDSYSQPLQLEATAYVAGQNITCRGGVAKTRPGSRSLLRLPDGNSQGMTLFSPASGYPYQVAAVDGKIYVSAPPFKTYTQLSNLQFAPFSRFVSFTTCLQSTSYNDLGEITFLAQPKAVLIMQDGLTRAAMWDGSVSRHLNPTQSGEEITPEGLDETPIGLWSVWSNNRLWVSRENQVFASDIGNPLKFTETQYINEARAFYLPSSCTGMVETTDQDGIIVFTENEGIFIRSSIQNRFQWLSTVDFQKTVLPNIGCIAPRSITTQYGLIWWYSPKGLMSLNSAIRANLSSKLSIQDNEMMASKYAVGSDLSRICGVSHENYMLMSVPYGDAYNTHTWALDQDPFGNEGADANSWASYWTGWRPVCWAHGQVFSEERTFFASKDYDGGNRIWEAFVQEPTDNGTPIECFLQTKEYAFGNGDRKRFEYAEIYACEIYGPVEFGVFVAGQKGGFQKIMEKRIVASEGQVIYGTEYGDAVGDLNFFGNRPQFRTIKTGELNNPNECNACGVESVIPNNIDRAFSLLIVWHGALGVNGLRVFARPDAENYGGACEDDEVGPRTLSFDGCGSSESLFVQNGPFIPVSATKIECVEKEGEDVEYCAEATVTTILSEAAADRLATIAAIQKASWLVANDDSE
jgi:hypothetical protein